VYNKAIASSKEVLLFNILNTWYDNLKVLTGTYLDIFSKESSNKIKITSLEESIKHQKPKPVLLY
jgi:hypothetical protein